MLQTIARYTPEIAALAFTLLGTILTRYVWVKVQHDWSRGVIQRGYAELVDAVLEVWQAYVSGIKEGAADGKLTEEEAQTAKQQAIAIAKSNLGEKGLRRLARALGFSDLGGAITHTELVDRWLESKSETAVASLKAAGMMRTAGSTADPT